MMEQNNNIDIQQISLSDWMIYVDEKGKQGFLTLERIRPYVEESLLSNDIRYCYFMKSYGNQLIRLESSTESFEQLYKRFFEFMEYTLGYYLCIFKDEAFQGEMEMLPKDAKAAVILHQMFSKVEDDWSGKILDAQECAKCYPCLKKNIDRLSKYMRDYAEG